MRIALTTSARTATQPNEDFVGAVANAVVLLDGAGISGIETICRHGVAWYTHRLGGALLGRLSRNNGQDLRDLLGEAIDEVTGQHHQTCDVADPSSPSATVVLFRLDGHRAEYLMLADSFLVLDRRGHPPLVITDEREVAVRNKYGAAMYDAAEGTPEYDRARSEYIQRLRALRNHPDGFWVAKNDPRAAAEAIRGTVPAADLTRAALLSNGASRIVDRFGLADWSQVLTILDTAGPAEVIRQVRQAETDDLAGNQPRPGEPSDDATVAYCTDLNEPA